MKKFQNILIVVFLLITCSCENDFGDINIDPNNPDEVPIEYLMTSAQKYLADENTGFASEYFALIVSQYWAQNNYAEESQWSFRINMNNYLWTTTYAQIMEDLDRIIKLANEDSVNPEKAQNQIAIARILKAYSIHFATDVWGAIPYSEALLGDQNRSPKYDSQKDIYFSILEELKDAIKQIDLNAESFGSADIIYNGDMSKWETFAHSLILRVAMRMSDVEGTVAQVAQNEVELAAQSAFTNNSDNANFYYLSAQPNTNLHNISRVTRGDADFCVSNILIDKTLKPLNDPRLPAFADEKENGGGFLGRPFGQNSGTAASIPPAEYSQPSGAAAVRTGSSFNPYDVLAPDAITTFMNYAEVCFILAEAKERGWNVDGTAEEWYNKGITASMEEWGITHVDTIQKYLNRPAVAYTTASGDWNQKIGIQKWIALYMQGVQGWSEWRRLDFVKLEFPVDGALREVGNKVAPARLTYPTHEQTLNAASYLDGVSLLDGPDKLYTRLWWDVE